MRRQPRQPPHRSGSASQAAAAATLAAMLACATATALPPSPLPTPRLSFDLARLLPRSDTAAACAPSLACLPALAASPAGRAAVALYAPTRDGGALATCSGVLVADADGAPAILTAQHCLRGGGGGPYAIAATPFDMWTVAFSHTAAPCGSSRRPSPRNLVQGVSLRFFDGGADVALLALPGGVPSAFGAVGAGYAAPTAPPPSLAVIGFPGGTPARVAVASNVSDAFAPPPEWPAANGDPPTNATHWRVAYADGATDGGSSGGLAVDPASGRVVGVLSGGFAACGGAAGGADYVGTLAAAFRAGLAAYLDANGSPGGRLLGGSASRVGFSPAALLVDAAETTASFDVFLTGPVANDATTLRVTFDIVPLPGTSTSADPRAAVGVDPPSVVLSKTAPAAAVRLIDRMPHRPLPNGMGRFYVAARVDSAAAAAAVAGAPAITAASAAAGDARLKVVVSRTPRGGLTLPPGDRGRHTAPLALAAPLHTATGKAAFRVDTPSASSTDARWDVRLCLTTPTVTDAAVAVYVNGSLARLVNGGGRGGVPSDPACVDVAGVAVPPATAMDVVVSDASFLDAVLPVGGVRSMVVGRAG